MMGSQYKRGVSKQKKKDIKEILSKKKSNK